MSTLENLNKASMCEWKRLPPVEATFSLDDWLGYLASLEDCKCFAQSTRDIAALYISDLGADADAGVQHIALCLDRLVGEIEELVTQAYDLRK